MRIAEIGNEIRQRLTFSGGVGRPRLGLGLRAAGLVILAIVLLYYPLGMLWVHEIDDDPEFGANLEVPDGGSRTVAVAAQLVRREIDRHRWTPNDPFFLPAAALDNMPNYQRGIVAALARFAFELTDQLGRTRGSSQTDPDLQDASGLLQYAGDVWIFDPRVSWFIPTVTSERQYRKASRSLASYNERLAAGNAVFERRADNLLATLDRFALDLGSSSAVLDRHIEEHSGDLIDFKSDDLFYGVKGQTYAYYLLLRELERDFAAVIKEREIANAWAQMLASMRHAALMHPTVVVNGAPDGQLMPSHLAAQGFYLLRARTQLREITNILLK